MCSSVCTLTVYAHMWVSVHVCVCKPLVAGKQKSAGRCWCARSSESHLHLVVLLSLLVTFLTPHRLACFPLRHSWKAPFLEASSERTALPLCLGPALLVTLKSRSSECPKGSGLETQGPKDPEISGAPSSPADGNRCHVHPIAPAPQLRVSWTKATEPSQLPCSSFPHPGSPAPQRGQVSHRPSLDPIPRPWTWLECTKEWSTARINSTPHF